MSLLHVSSFRSFSSLLTMALMLGSVSLATASLEAAPPAAAHAHPDKGPHGGPLLELGEEEYHLEVVLDEKNHALTLYLLDAAAKNAVTTDAKEVTINLKHAGKPVQYKVPAIPNDKDPAGMASEFRLKEAKLVHALHHKDHNARVNLKIRGKAFSAKFDLKHDHDHKD